MCNSFYKNIAYLHVINNNEGNGLKMKKTLSMILALLIITCSMSAVITSYAENSTNLLANKKAADWTGYQWSKISDSEVSKDGGNGILVESAMHQSIYTTVTLKPNTAYDFSFNWKSVENDKGPAFPSVIQVYSASEVDIEDRATNWKDGGAFNPKTGTDLEKGSNYTNEDNAKTYKWQNLSTGFVTGNDTEYHLIIRFVIKGSNNHQAINLSDFILEEVKPEIVDISTKLAADWTGYQWSKISDSVESKDGGNGYLVESAMHQSIYTDLTLNPNTEYKLSFNWKSVENDKGPAFPSVIQVYSASEVDIEDRATNWKNGGTFTPATGIDLEQGSNYTNEEIAKTYKWQNLSTNFTTTNDSEYNLIIRFGIVGSNNKQAINLSDFILEEVGSADDGEEPDDDDTVVDEGNLAANFSAASGNVTWTDNAKNITFSDRVSDLEGGLSWGFGMSKTLFEAGYTNTGEWFEPAYVNIKTDELKAEHKYEFSYIFQKDYLIVFDSIDADAEIIKTEDVKLLNGDRAHRITVRFLAKNSGVHNIKLKMGKGKNNENCQWNYVILSDLKLYDATNRVYGSIKSELGGTVSGFDNSYCLKGDNVTLIATPLSSNTFEGWFDTEGNLVSTNAKFEFVAENDFEYTACFLGGNLPNTEWLAEHGMDGTFENGGMDGWKAEDRNDGESSAWAKFERSTDIAYNGDYSLRFYARYRTSFFTFNNLKKSTNYLLTFYVNDRAVFDPREDESDLDYNEEARINWFSITSGATTLYEDFGTSDAPSMKGGSGWYKVSIPFNTGDFTNVDWNLYYTNKDKQPDNYIYMDDISLVEYTVDNFSNGDFEDSSSVPWRGNFTIENGAGKGNNLYQNANLQAQSSYTVTFKAKGNGVAGASVITTKPFDCTNYISSDSSVNINSTEWKTYSFNVFTGVYPHAAIFFKANEGDILVDDVTLTKNLDRGNSIVEKIDFETDRFALHTNSNVFEIYNGTIGDANVYSGTKSLKFNSANAQKGVAYLLEDAFVSVQLGAKINYKLTIYYKTTKGNSIYLAPNYLPDDGVKTVYTSANNGWTKVEFTFNRRKLSYAKVMIGNVLGKTNADFYIDDITLTVMPPMVLETNSKNKYCEYPLNVLNNQGFEDKITNADWINLPKTAKVRTDKAFAGKKYLRINASTYYVLPVNIEANESYYFSISSRLGGNSSGYVAVATNPEGTNLYNDVNGRIASKIVVDTEKWNRDSFLFSTSESGIVYLVFAVQKGYIDIDEVHLYKQQYGKETDPNNHTFVPFDFKNLDPDLAVLNGGKPHDTNYDDSQDGSGATDEYGSSPQTGDNRTAPAIVLIVSTIAAMVLMFSTKRTREKFKGGKA